ncbi:E3 ubiquitin-protein ligase, putative [Plasmodium gaboni]|uniref:E3 ubiquitin-protein ligase, putative n=1 Tax=Plasmodium gaboni TaxID=647221 RepID=A0ABY0KWH0_9APIC|nr:E3 ubiquitin-protein ligase, putative [Plasmodium gaboni]
MRMGSQQKNKSSSKDEMQQYFEEHFMKEDKNIDMNKNEKEEQSKKNENNNSPINLSESVTQNIINSLLKEIENNKISVQETNDKIQSGNNKKLDSQNVSNETSQNIHSNVISNKIKNTPSEKIKKKNINVNLHPLFWYLVMNNSSYVNLSKFHHYHAIDRINMNSINKLLEYRNENKNVEDLHLDFTLLGSNPPVELIPNGSNITVTNENLNLFINKTIEYSLYDGIKFQIWAFRYGF